MKSVRYLSSNLLTCGCGSEILICLDDVPVPSGAPYINGLVGLVSKSFIDCTNIYCYSLMYDEGQLTDPSYSLVETDITGVVCKDCIVTYIDYSIASLVRFTVTDTDTIDLTLTGVNLSADVKLDGSPLNSLSVTPGNGLFSPLVTTTSTSNLYLTTVGPNFITGNVNLSAIAFNAISDAFDGIYSPAVQVTDSTTIDFSLLALNSVTGSVKLSADIGNSIVVHADGLYNSTTLITGAWHIIGDRGQTDGVNNLLGTLDNIPLRLIVNSLAAGKCTYAAVSPIWELGPSSNVTTYIQGEMLLGGRDNSILTSGTEDPFYAGGSHHFATIIGSSSATIMGTSDGCTILNARGSTISFAQWSSILGGKENAIQATGANALKIVITDGSVIVGGNNGVVAAGLNSSVTGGYSNVLEYTDSGAILGGNYNHIGAYTTNSVITYNTCSAIVGGYVNNIEKNNYASILGGAYNSMTEAYTLVLFPGVPWVSGSVISGGVKNTIATHIRQQHGQFKSPSAIIGGIGLKLGEGSCGFQADVSDNPSSTLAYAAAYVQTDLSSFEFTAYFGDVDVWIGNVGGAASKVKFYGPNLVKNYSGATYSSIEAQAQGSNIQYKLPAVVGAIGQTLKIQGISGTQVTLEWA